MGEYDYEGRFNYDDDRFSAHYAKHVDAMTRESLHSKSAIAVELAWRDLEIERLSAQLKETGANKPKQIYRPIKVSLIKNNTLRRFCIVAWFVPLLALAYAINGLNLVWNMAKILIDMPKVLIASAKSCWGEPADE